MTPLLTDGAVSLRPHQESDLAEMVAMATDPEAVERTTVPLDYDEAAARHWAFEVVPRGWAGGSMWGWAIEATDESGAARFAGNVDIRVGSPPDLGFALAPWARGQGLMSRAVRLAARWAFDEGGLRAIHWAAHAGHLPSWRVAHATGFTFDGARPQSIAHRGELRDGWWGHLSAGDPMDPRTVWREPVVLEGDAVRLRPHADADLERIVAACSDERTRHWLAGMPSPYTLDHAGDFVRKCRLEESLGTGVTWAIADRATDVQLANIGLFDLADPMRPLSAEVGYWAHPDARGRGVVGEAVQLVLRHAFAPEAQGGLARRRVQLGASWENAASRHIAERAGFTLVGHHRADGVLGDGTHGDGAWYDLLAEEFHAL